MHVRVCMHACMHVCRYVWEGCTSWLIYIYIHTYMQRSQVPRTCKQTVAAWRNTYIKKKQPRLWWSMCLESSWLWPVAAVASLEAFLLPIPMEFLLASSRIHFSNNNRCDCEKSELMTWYRSSRDKYWRHLLIWFNKKWSESPFGDGDDPLGRSFSFEEANETLRSYLNGWQKSTLRKEDNWFFLDLFRMIYNWPHQKVQECDAPSSDH